MNAKLELLGILKDCPPVKCAYITYKPLCLTFGLDIYYVFNVGAFEEFLSQLNFEYDEDMGEQELFGTVWFEDGTWLSREEYNGREWWVHNICPPIPTDCFN